MFPMRLALERVARHFPHLPAMIKEDGTHESWADHVGCVARLAGVVGELGMAPGARFAILALNSVDQATLIHAGYWSGRLLTFGLQFLNLWQCCERAVHRFSLLTPFILMLRARCRPMAGKAMCCWLVRGGKA